MSKVTKRIIVGVTGVPLLFGIVYLLPYYKHLALNIIIIVITAITSMEISSFFSNKGFATNPFSTPFLGACLPIVAYLEIMNILPNTSLLIVLIVLASLILIREVFIKSKEEFPNILFRVSSSMIVLLYPGLLLAFLVKFANLSFPSNSYVLLMAFVFTNDTLAYTIGMLFGKNSRGVTFISPNKSLVGFAGGICGSIMVGVFYWFFLRNVISESLITTIIVSIVIGFTTIFGDLVASALKRSAEMKDSGNIIPGRGGLLDSVDSFMFSAPVLYFILNILQK